MGGPAGVGGASTVDWSRQVCEAPPPEEQVCSLPPEDLVCEAEPEATSTTESHVAVGAHNEHTSDANTVSFPSAAGSVADATRIPRRIAQANTILRTATGVGGTASQVAGKVLAPVAIVGGTAEIINGVDRIQNGETAEGILDVAGGGAAVTAGTATLVGATSVAPVAAAAGAGLAVGRAGDNYSKELDIYGNGNSASEELGDVAVAAGSAAAEWTGSETVGDVVGIGTVIVASPVYAAHAVGSFVVGGASDAWSYIWD